MLGRPLDAEQAGEREALGWLRASVLADPAQDRQAWAALAEKVLRAGSARSRVDRRRLRELLLTAGVRLAVPVDLRADVERLKLRSQTALAHMAPHAALSIAGTAQRLSRALAEPLRARVLDGSCLVVGAPGAGKSGALHTLAEALQAAGHDLVVLAADTLQIADLDELRLKLGLDRPLEQVLADWPGERPGILIVDALDAARGADGPAALIDLVDRVAGTDDRWNVVATVRTFDLRHNRVLRAALPARAAREGHRDPEFLDVEHFAVGELDDGELAQLAELAPAVHAVLQDAPAPLRELVANPFNLSLLARLVQRDVDPARLRPLRTQDELLGLHWRTWVLDPAAGSDDRQRLLGRVCERAVVEMRLQVERQAVIGAADGASLQDLLAAGVLIETPGGLAEPDRVAFSHHVLFDYGFARVALPRDPAELAERLSDTPDTILLARPALVMRLAALWELNEERRSFWQCALALADDTLADPVRLVAPSVVVELLERPEQMHPLVQAARDDSTPAARSLLREITSALLAQGSDGRPLEHADANLWAGVAALIAEGPVEGMLEPLHRLVWALWRETDQQEGPPAAAPAPPHSADEEEPTT